MQGRGLLETNFYIFTFSNLIYTQLLTYDNNSPRMKLIIKYFPNFKLLKLNISDKNRRLLKKLESTFPKLPKHSDQSLKSTVADSYICLLGKIISAEVRNI